MHVKMQLGELGCTIKCSWVSVNMQLGQLGELGCIIKCSRVSVNMQLDQLGKH